MATPKFRVGDRVRLKISLSDKLRKGATGSVTRVLVNSLYDVRFDTSDDGQPISPPADETVAEKNLELSGGGLHQSPMPLTAKTATESLSEFIKLVNELEELVDEWKLLTPIEKAQREDEFRKRHKGIATRMDRLPKPSG